MFLEINFQGFASSDVMTFFNFLVLIFLSPIKMIWSIFAFLPKSTSYVIIIEFCSMFFFIIGFTLEK